MKREGLAGGQQKTDGDQSQERNNPRLAGAEMASTTPIRASVACAVEAQG
jgi:hypothetical protein